MKNGKEKKYPVVNWGNALMSSVAILAGAALLIWSITLFAWIGIIIGALLFVSGAGVAILQPTHAIVSASEIKLYYGFGLFYEGALWSDITAVYENNYKNAKKSDREKVFYFEGMTSPRPREFMHSEIARSDKLRSLITEFWGAPLKRTEKND